MGPLPPRGPAERDLDLSDRASATAKIAFQVDRQGCRQPLKTDEAEREVALPGSLAVVLHELRLRTAYSDDSDFVFCTGTGRALSQRNVTRELRRAQAAARDEDARPTFPELHDFDSDGRRVRPPRGTL